MASGYYGIEDPLLDIISKTAFILVAECCLSGGVQKISLLCKNEVHV